MEQDVEKELEQLREERAADRKHIGQLEARLTELEDLIGATGAALRRAGLSREECDRGGLRTLRTSA